jgi:hypothetical protein
MPPSVANSSSAPEANSSGSSSSTASCEAQMLTFSLSGFVVVRKVVRWDDATPAGAARPEGSGADSNTPRAHTRAAVKKSANSRKKMSSIVWKGEYFPLWKRLLRKLRPLPIPLLAYTFSEYNLTIWRTKNVLPDLQTLQHEQTALVTDSSQLWKVFKARSL